MKLQVATAALLVTLAAGPITWTAEPAPEPSRADIQKQFGAGNFKAAYDGFRRLALDPADDPKSIGDDLNKAGQALQQLGRLEELDDLRDKVIRIHGQNWPLLWAAADNYFQSSHDGTLVAGKFIRADQKSGGRAVNALERDRVRALQLMVAAMKLIPAQPPGNRAAPNATELKPTTDAAKATAERAKPLRAELADFFFDLARLLASAPGLNGGFEGSFSAAYGDCDGDWRLQTLTNLDRLPDYSDGHNLDPCNVSAPVGNNGRPIYYTLPKSWSAALNDGQRWRWALSEAALRNPDRRAEAQSQFAAFLLSQFGVQTMADYGSFFADQELEEVSKQQDSALQAAQRMPSRLRRTSTCTA